MTQSSTSTAQSPPSTPKRKLGQTSAAMASLPRTQFLFEFHNPLESGSASPRSKVAYKFQGLSLESGGGAAPDLAPKRRSLDEGTPKPRSIDDAAHTSLPERRVQKRVRFLDDNDIEMENPGSTSAGKPASQQPGFSPTVLPTSESNTRDGDKDGETSETESMTWRHDEITVYDPNDSEDDGTGMDGVGFKPTPEREHNRSLFRQQQIRNYRIREQQQARARRSARRALATAAVPVAPREQEQEPRNNKRVRFAPEE